jgi:recombination protein RecR
MLYSPLIAKLIEDLRTLPGVGPKSAQRMAFELLQRKREAGIELAKTLNSAMELVGNCNVCRNFCETEICPICSDNRRNSNNICIVESPADVIAIEQTGCFNGYYFVLMGHLSPLDGIGPNDIGIPKLLERVKELEIKELIIATNSTPEGEATAFYITEQVKSLNAICSRIASGIPIGGELEYLDSGTVSKALFARTNIVTEKSYE